MRVPREEVEEMAPLEIEQRCGTESLQLEATRIRRHIAFTVNRPYKGAIRFIVTFHDTRRRRSRRLSLSE